MFANILVFCQHWRMVWALFITHKSNLTKEKFNLFFFTTGTIRDRYYRLTSSTRTRNRLLRISRAVAKSTWDNIFIFSKLGNEVKEERTSSGTATDTKESSGEQGRYNNGKPRPIRDKLEPLWDKTNSWYCDKHVLASWAQSALRLRHQMLLTKLLFQLLGGKRELLLWLWRVTIRFSTTVI